MSLMQIAGTLMLSLTGTTLIIACYEVLKEEKRPPLMPDEDILQGSSYSPSARKGMTKREVRAALLTGLATAAVILVIKAKE